METTTASRRAIGALRNDPITFEVLRNAFKSICNEASALIERVSYAPTITEGHDYSVSILTPDGRLVSHGQRDQAPHLVHARFIALGVLLDQRLAADVLLGDKRG